MPSADLSVTPASALGASSFASMLSPILVPPSLPSLPTTLLSARRAGRRRSFDPRQQQSAAAPAISAANPSNLRGLEGLGLAVRGEPAPKATGPVSREMAVWSRQAGPAMGAGNVMTVGRLMAAAAEEKEAENDIEAEKLAAKNRRESRHATWNHFATSSSSASPHSLTRPLLPAVHTQTPAVHTQPPAAPSSASAFVATHRGTASTGSTMTVALTSMATGDSSPRRPFTSYSPIAGRNASNDLTPLVSTTPHESRSPASALVHHTVTDDLITKPSARAGRRRSSLPLPASPPKSLASISSSKRGSAIHGAAPQRSGEASPSSSSPVWTAAYLAARSRGSSVWARSAVDRFGGADKPSDPEGEKNAWGFQDVDVPPPTAQSAATTTSAPRALHSAAAAHSSGSVSPRPGTAGSPSSSLPARPWNFGYVPTEEKGLRRTRNVQVEVDPHAYLQRTTTRTQQSVPHFEPIRVARPVRRRKPADSSEEFEERPWGHWAHAGLTEEPKHPFPGRKFIFRDCPLRKSECSDPWCARHNRRAGDEEAEAEEPEVEEKRDEVEAAEVEVEAEVEEDGVGAVDNMAVVRLRGASDRALQAAFARATPAYANLARMTDKALADSTELHKAPVVDQEESAEESTKPVEETSVL